jgi:hypothetical protein
MCSVPDPACVQSVSHIFAYTQKPISCYLLSGFSYSCFQMVQISTCVHINVVLYMAPKERIKLCQIRAPRWPRNWTTPANMSWEMRRCAVLLMATRETVWEEECKGTTFSVMSSVCLETELPGTPPRSVYRGDLSTVISWNKWGPHENLGHTRSFCSWFGRFWTP